MTRDKKRATVILLLFAGLIPILFYSDSVLFSTDSLIYLKRGLSFTVRRYTDTVISIGISRVIQEDPPPELAGGKIIIPGRGVGDIGIGDSLDRVEDILPVDWKKYGYRELVIYSSRDHGISLQFMDGRLTWIQITASEYQTREGISVGSGRDAVLEVYGEPPSGFYTVSGLYILSGIYTITTLGTVALHCLHFLIAAGLLSLLKSLLERKGVRNTRIILISASFLIFLVIRHLPNLIIVGPFYLKSFIQLEVFSGLFFSISIYAGTFAGILLGESRARRNGWTGGKKHFLPALSGDLLLVGIFIIWRICRYLLGFWPFSIGVWTDLYILIYGPLLYLFWYQFNVLFAPASRVPVAPIPPIL